jgi:hypothetical protein
MRNNTLQCVLPLHSSFSQDRNKPIFKAEPPQSPTTLDFFIKKETPQLKFQKEETAFSSQNRKESEKTQQT